MSQVRIIPGDLYDPQIRALLAVHLERARALTPACSVHALDVEALKAPGVQFFAAWDGETLLGFGALKRLSGAHAEIKSMHTAEAARRRGVGAAMLSHLIAKARAAGLDRVSLETGAPDDYIPARALYARYGFVECEPFEGYLPDHNSVFMTLALAGATPARLTKP